ncbi:MAG: sulfite exporter TauE/SafE family protein [Betaproteobacteria bacterium]
MESATTSLMASGFVLGAVSGVHCVGMCGGIVAAFSSQPGIVRIVRKGGAGTERPRISMLGIFNLGRVGAYTLAGGMAGLAGSAGAYAAGVIDIQVALYIAANLMLVLAGLYLAGLSPVLATLERMGGPLWRHIQPAAARWLPADTPARAFIAGSLWGWLPCGLVYGMLVTALASGSATRGALAMFAFGMGTVLNLMLAGLAFSHVHRFATRRAVRLVAGAVVLGFGLVGLARATGVGSVLRRGLFCLDFG